jgi:hypothetical protein
VRSYKLQSRREQNVLEAQGSACHLAFGHNALARWRCIGFIQNKQAAAY